MSETVLEQAKAEYATAVERLKQIAPDLTFALPGILLPHAAMRAQRTGSDPPAPKELPAGRSHRGEGRVFQRKGSSKWWIAYYAPKGGRSVEHREPGGATEKEARNKLKDRLNEVANHFKGIQPFQGPRQQRVTVEQLLHILEQHYKINEKASWRKLNSHLRHIRAFFGMDRALAVTPDRLMNYVAMRKEEHAQPATVNRELEGLQQAFRLAVKQTVLSFAPMFPSLPERNAREGFFERGEFETVLANLTFRGKLDTDIQDFCEWFYWTGMRPGEIRALTWAGFDRETWTLRLHARNAKTRKSRVLALEGQLRRIIERRLRVRRLDCPLIFHRDGRAVGDFRKVWKRACKAAGLVGRIPYDLRRTAVRNMVRAGVDPVVAMRISGHRTRSMFDRYDVISDEDIREAVLKTNTYVTNLPAESKVAPIQATAVEHAAG